MKLRNFMYGTFVAGSLLGGISAMGTFGSWMANPVGTERALDKLENRPFFHNTTETSVVDSEQMYSMPTARDTVIIEKQSGALGGIFRIEDKVTRKPESDVSYTERTGIKRTTLGDYFSDGSFVGRHQYEPNIDVNNPESYENVKNSIKRMMYHCEPAAVNSYDDIGYSIYKGLAYDRFADTLRFNDDIKPIIKDYALKAYKEIKHIK